ncbi:DNA-binding protein [Yersinia aleksiciae]|uniref:DNA-binding protein n=1 Tax=Yersinia aleksiciae TaxID=263819 RepID=UPI0011A3DC1E|nr:DNA-binding protein [Yersinia aleksiciae]
MQFYHFSLMLAGVTAETAGLKDSLFSHGCDDALICFYGKSVYLEFDRQSGSISHAVLSAINNIESANLGATVIAVDAHYVGLSDIASLSHMSRQAVAMLKDGTRGPGDFPAPIQRLNGSSPLWNWASVAEWLSQHGKLDAQMAHCAQILADINLALQLRAAKDRNNVNHYLSLLEHPTQLAEFCQSAQVAKASSH